MPPELNMLIPPFGKHVSNKKGPKTKLTFVTRIQLPFRLKYKTS